MFIPNHEQAQHIIILSYKMLMDTYPREYNKLKYELLTITIVVFLYANERMVRIALA
jgi:hypothetical protein